jgi:hypothetical protein
MRLFAIGAHHGLEMLHKSGMVFQVAPELVDLGGGFVDRNGRAERNAMARITVCGVYSQGSVCRAIACEATIYKGATTKHQR